MSNYSSSFLQLRRQQWLDSLKTFEYCQNGVWFNGSINSKTVDGEYLIVLVDAPSTGSSGTITAARVIDETGIVAASWIVDIQRTSTQNALLKFSFPIKEV